MLVTSVLLMGCVNSGTINSIPKGTSLIADVSDADKECLCIDPKTGKRTKKCLVPKPGPNDSAEVLVARLKKSELGKTLCGQRVIAHYEAQRKRLRR